MKNNAIWRGFTYLVGFLVVFRTSQAYSRFWEGCTATHSMGAEWFDACSSLVAFSLHAPPALHLEVAVFQNLLVRLFSMLHSAALGDVEDSSGGLDISAYRAFQMELIDAAGIDGQSLDCIRTSHSKVELIFHWIQQLIVESVGTGVMCIPPPILARALEEMASGLVHFHHALKISVVPFPFPYAQTCDIMLLMHWMMVPLIVCQWVSKWYLAFIFAFIQVFTLQALNLISMELEHPFGTDPNDIDAEQMQKSMNAHLRLLLRESTKRTPTLRHDDQKALLLRVAEPDEGTLCSFFDVWMALDDDNTVFRRGDPSEESGRRLSSRQSKNSWRSNLSSRSKDSAPVEPKPLMRMPPEVERELATSKIALGLQAHLGDDFCDKTQAPSATQGSIDDAKGVVPGPDWLDARIAHTFVVERFWNDSPRVVETSLKDGSRFQTLEPPRMQDSPRVTPRGTPRGGDADDWEADAGEGSHDRPQAPSATCSSSAAVPGGLFRGLSEACHGAGPPSSDRPQALSATQGSPDDAKHVFPVSGWPDAWASETFVVESCWNDSPRVVETILKDGRRFRTVEPPNMQEFPGVAPCSRDADAGDGCCDLSTACSSSAQVLGGRLSLEAFHGAAPPSDGPRAPSDTGSSSAAVAGRLFLPEACHGAAPPSGDRPQASFFTGSCRTAQR
ncbi:unnamed protein product [Prorocentrum cordatum]|uniref:Bestrophin n=1 Tax=Prorocentrum cordatum TaxID=2364126 RepID=A0ABN9QU70_9DINO|nr:unnamed protein product [Polarella glacialis]